jgi:hypothetical protein
MDGRNKSIKDVMDVNNEGSDRRKETVDLLKNMTLYKPEISTPRALEPKSMPGKEDLRVLEEANTLISQYYGHSNFAKPTTFAEREPSKKEEERISMSLREVVGPNMRTFLLNHREQFGTALLKTQYTHLYAELQRVDNLQEQALQAQWKKDITKTIENKQSELNRHITVRRNEASGMNRGMKDSLQQKIDALKGDVEFLAYLSKKTKAPEIKEMKLYMQLKMDDMNKSTKLAQDLKNINSEISHREEKKSEAFKSEMLTAWDLSQQIVGTRGNRISDRFEQPLEKPLHDISEKMDQLDNHYLKTERVIMEDIYQRDKIKYFTRSEVLSHIKDEKNDMVRQKRTELNRQRRTELNEGIARVDRQHAMIDEAQIYA